MNNAASLQTVLTAIAGATQMRTRSFPWGTTVQPISVGKQGDWRIDAVGVEPVHFYVAFDGRMIHAASASTGRVWLGETELGPSWVVVPVGSEIRFGEARVGVTCEEAPGTVVVQRPPVAAAPAPGQWKTQLIAPQAKAPVLGVVTVQAAPQPATPPAAIKGTPVAGTVLLAQSPLRRAPEGANMAPPAAPLAPAPVAPAPLAAPAAIAPAAVAPAPAAAAPAAVAPAGPPAAAPAAVAPAAAVPFAPAQEPRARNPLPLSTLESAANAPQPLPPTDLAQMSSVPSVRRPLGALVQAGAQHTVSDEGALRELADQVAQKAQGSELGPAGITQDAAPVVRPGQPGSSSPNAGYGAPNAAGYVPYSPQQNPGHGPPNAEAFNPQQHAGYGGQNVGYGPPGGAPGGASSTPKDASNDSIQLPISGLLESFRKVSLPVKLALLFLPVAGYFALLWEPEKPQQVRRSSGAKTPATATATATVTAAPVQTVATALPTPTPYVNEVTPVESARAAVTSPPPSSTRRASSGGRRRADKEQAKSSPQRDALMAAFEGNLTDASRRYAALAVGQDAQLYSLAARFTRENAVRKP